MKRWMLQVFGPDQPGIVAGVAGQLADHGCNLLDVAMSRLSGEFVMLAVLDAPDDLSPTATLDLQGWTGRASAFLLTDEVSAPAEGEPWAITVYGSDRPGIVAAVTKALAGRGVNIDDLSTRASGEAGAPTYTMLIDATVPAAVDGDAFAAELTAIGERLGVSCHARPVDTDTF